MDRLIARLRDCEAVVANEFLTRIDERIAVIKARVAFADGIDRVSAL